jgi:hypothetical protein
MQWTNDPLPNAEGRGSIPLCSTKTHLFSVVYKIVPAASNFM